MPNLTLQYNAENYIEFVHLIAGKMHVPVKDNLVEIPASYGKGFAWAKNLPGGLSVLVSDVRFEQEMIMERLAGYRPFYILQFNEVMEEETGMLQGKGDMLRYMHDSFVALANGQLEAKRILPPGVRARSVFLIFERAHLLQFLKPDLVDFFLGNYFARLLQTGIVEPLDADYRMLLDVLLQPVIDHPLPANYIANRCTLLLERFVMQVISKIEDTAQLAYKLGADTVNRLMRVEARLVKDFTVPPATIEVLAVSAAMSATKLKRDFKLLYGLPIYEYYQRHRMKKARILLTESDYSIKEVGTMVGYSNLSHFASSFKKEFGILPSELSARDAVLPIERIG